MFVLNTIQPTRRPISFPKFNDPACIPGRHSPRHPIHRLDRDVKHLYIAVVQAGNEVRCKVGITSNLEKRFRSLQAANAFHVELYKEYNWYFLVKHLAPKNQKKDLCREVELIVKKKFKDKTSHHNSTEWYNISPEKLEAFIDKVMNLRFDTVLPYGVNDNGEWEEYCNKCLSLRFFGEIGCT